MTETPHGQGPGSSAEPSAESSPGERPSEEELLRDDLDELAGELVAQQGATVTTGHDGVDEVLRSLDALDAAPVDAHVAVFEQAHEQLRRTLSGAGDDQA